MEGIPPNPPSCKLFNLQVAKNVNYFGTGKYQIAFPRFMLAPLYLQFVILRL